MNILDRKITLAEMLSWSPCYGREKSETRWLRAFPSGVATVRQALKTKRLPAADKLWLILREPVLPADILRELACDFATRALERYGGEVDDCSWTAIDISLAYVAGLADANDLDAARDAAGVAAWDAAGDEARAAMAAAGVAAGVAAWSAAGAAARASESRAQVAHVLEVLEEEKP